MDEDLREQFTVLLARCRKMNAAFSSKCEMQTNELAILKIISGECTCCSGDSVSLNMQSIQERLQISKPAVSYTLNSLEKKSYIVREIDPTDRRRIAIHVTPEGKASVEISLRQHAEMWDQIVAEFGEENMIQLTNLLSQFFSTLDDICE